MLIFTFENNSSTAEEKVGGCLSLTFWSTEQVPGELGVHRESLTSNTYMYNHFLKINPGKKERKEWREGGRNKEWTKILKQASLNIARN